MKRGEEDKCVNVLMGRGEETKLLWGKSYNGIHYEGDSGLRRIFCESTVVYSVLIIFVL